MFEAEVNGRKEPTSQIPVGVLARFRELSSVVTDKTVLPWSEHCTECTAPACYTTCSLYEPRRDFKCRRFTDGMVVIEDAASINGQLLKIRFKRWGELWTYANTRMFSRAGAAGTEKRDRLIGGLIFNAPLSKRLKTAAIQARYNNKKRAVEANLKSDQRPNCFVLECYNPNIQTIELSLTMSSSRPNANIKFQRLISLPQGFTRERIAYDEIAKVLDLDSLFYISIVPNDIADGTPLYFGLLDFVYDPSFVQPPAQPNVKCVVWDLDDTLWHGVLVEQGSAGLKPRPEALETIMELDRRGILNSAASKNNPEEARAAIKQFGYEDYLLHPQISWEPKSVSLQRLSGALNIGLDTLLFVDDSAFERAEVHNALPSVRVVDAIDCRALLQRADCNPPWSAEAASRRKHYQEANVRDSAAEEFGNDYFAFLRDCRIELGISPLTEANLERVHELTQRTNQMNFSGNLYTREILEEILRSGRLKAFVLDCRDRFGSYGTIGFCLADPVEPRVTDLMFSCRIQSKRVEHAFLSYLLRDLTDAGARACYFRIKKTSRNAPAARVFEDFGMEVVEERDGVTLLVFSPQKPIPDDGLVRVSVTSKVSDPLPMAMESSP